VLYGVRRELEFRLRSQTGAPHSTILLLRPLTAPRSVTKLLVQLLIDFIPRLFSWFG
jgi:hypothetical protein